MTISNPPHWKWAYQDKGFKYDKIVEIISDVNTNTPAVVLNSTHRSSDGKDHSDVVLNNTHRANDDIHVDFVPAFPYVVELSANILQGYVSNQSNTQNVDREGVHQNATGTQYIYLEFAPPEWLMRYAEDQGQTIVLTQIIVRWDNTISADYVARLEYYWVDNNSSSSTQLYASGLVSLGSGSTGFRNDTMNGSDVSMLIGNAIHVRIDVQQTTINTCRIRGLACTYTLL